MAQANSSSTLAGEESRLEHRFATLRAEGRAGLVTFTMAGDPDYETSLQILRGLPAAGASVIEIGMPFSDPMADGPAVQAAGQRALRAGMSLEKTLQMVSAFREKDRETPIVLMGYYNPIYIFGVEHFLQRASSAGVDGLIIVDLPPEEDSELCEPALRAGLHWIRLATPTTDSVRLPRVLHNTSGFLYYVSVMGITGTRSATEASIREAITHLREHCDLPIAVGFGIKTPEQAAVVAKVADGAVVGSALVDRVKQGLDDQGRPTDSLVPQVLSLVSSLANGVRHARD